MEREYKTLLLSILENGELQPNRTGTAAYSLFGSQLNFNVRYNFPLITGKFIDFRIIETEFEWFITGQTTTKIFNDRGIKIWDAWADNAGNLGPVYGFQMLSFNGSPCNQLHNLIKGLTENPYSRRHIISLWNPLQIKDMALPPCYLYFQFFVHTNGRLDMFVVQRSGDMFAGIPYDMGLFSRFLIFVAYKSGLIPNDIKLNIVNAHIYENHVEGVKQYLSRPIYDLPTWKSNGENVEIINYTHGPKIPIKIAV